MPPRNLLRAFLVLWIVTGSALLIASVATMLEAVRSHPNPHLVLLGAVDGVHRPLTREQFRSALRVHAPSRP